MRLALLVLLCGCDVMWKIDHLKPADAAVVSIDAEPIDASCLTIPEPATADVMMYSAVGTVRDQGHPIDAIMNIGVPQSGEGLVRFAMPTQDATGITALHLTIPYVPNGNGCNGNCGNCGALDRDGAFDIEFATSQWDELAACYDRPTSTGTWGALGAMGPNDRSIVVGSANYVHQTMLEIELDATQVGPWVQSGRLSLILTGASPTGQIVAGQKDFATSTPACSPIPQPVTLDVTVCR